MNTILKFIDVNNREHLQAIDHLIKTGKWPEDFYYTYLKELEFEHLWHYTLMSRMAMEYLAIKLFDPNQD